MKIQSPEIAFKELFVDLHLSGIWDDGKFITDAIPNDKPEIILSKYRSEKDNENFNLKAFFNQHFQAVETASTNFKSDTSKSVEHHINRLWEVLKRDADKATEGSSLVPLPYSYIVPGGRFNEIYYWDSYFTMLGLQVSRKVEIIQSMIDNFSYLIETVGFIPNGNRTYFLGRSQPPFYSLMIGLLAEELSDEIYVKYLPTLLKEYSFWMRGEGALSEETMELEHVVLVDNSLVLNRYYDRNQNPRAEMYGADMETFEEANRNFSEFFLDIRAACESGWDFSSRWLDESLDLGSIHTSKILPVDLNCLLYHLEKTIAKAYSINKNKINSEHFEYLSNQRKSLISEYFWNEEIGFFCDYNFEKGKLLSLKSLAGMFPLFFKIATQKEAEKCAELIENEFLKPGGLVTTTIESGQQWDSPNGWAPLQWIAIQGLRNYGFNKLAHQIKENWVNLNQKVFKQTGKLLEKYNVVDTSLLSGGGEYPVQDGFGWTNGVLLKLITEK